MKKLYCVICGTYRKCEKPYILPKISKISKNLKYHIF